jgi:hypothetical protein
MATVNSTNPKVVVQWLNHPDIYRDCATKKVPAWLTVKCCEIATFSKPKTVNGNYA